MPKLTQRFIEALRADGGDEIVFDETVPGFGVRVYRSGRKSYVIQYRSQKRTRRYTIGNCNVLTTLQAREEARSLLAGVRKGKDPAQESLMPRYGTDSTDRGMGLKGPIERGV